jgi:hypothetical protein
VAKTPRPKKPPVVTIDFPHDGARMPIRGALTAFGALSVPLDGNSQRLTAQLSWPGGSVEGQPLAAAALPKRGDKPAFDWGFTFPLAQLGPEVRRLELVVRLLDDQTPANVLASDTAHVGRAGSQPRGRKTAAAIQELLRPPSISYPTSSTTGISRSFVALGTISWTPASMSATVSNPDIPDTATGTQQVPAPSGYDWAFQFSIPGAWSSASTCMLTVTATDGDGHNASGIATGLQFA